MFLYVQIYLFSLSFSCIQCKYIMYILILILLFGEWGNKSIKFKILKFKRIKYQTNQ